MIKITQRAIEYIRSLMEKEGLKYPGGIRFGIKAGGCQGLHYFHQLVKGDNRDDRITMIRGVRVLIDPKSVSLLTGVEIDLSDNLLDGTFKYTNPNAKSSCGCGTSFEPK